MERAEIGSDTHCGGIPFVRDTLRDPLPSEGSVEGYYLLRDWLRDTTSHTTTEARGTQLIFELLPYAYIVLF